MTRTAIDRRFQMDTTSHCAHGETNFFNRSLDWKPFKYLSLEQNSNRELKLAQTRRLVDRLDKDFSEIMWPSLPGQL